MLLTVDGNEIYCRDVKLDERGIIQWNLDPTTTRNDSNFLPDDYILTTSHDTFCKPLEDSEDAQLQHPSDDIQFTTTTSAMFRAFSAIISIRCITSYHFTTNIAAMFTTFSAD